MKEELSVTKCLGQSPEDDGRCLYAFVQRILLIRRMLVRYCTIAINLSSQPLQKERIIPSLLPRKDILKATIRCLQILTGCMKPFQLLPKRVELQDALVFFSAF